MQHIFSPAELPVVVNDVLRLTAQLVSRAVAIASYLTHNRRPYRMSEGCLACIMHKIDLG